MSDVSKVQPKVTAGLDIGDKYSYVCLIDAASGEIVEEGRLRTSPETFRRRFASERPMRIAIEAGTPSPWASRVLEECGHEVLVANARKLRLIYARASVRPTRSMPKTSHAWHASIRSYSTHSGTGAKAPRPTWP